MTPNTECEGGELFAASCRRYNIQEDERNRLLECITVKEYLSDYQKIFSQIDNQHLAKNAKNIVRKMRLKWGGEDIASYPEFMQFVINIEDDIITDTSLSEDEKEKLLSMTSVYRHSAYEWSGTSDSPFAMNLYNNEFRAWRFWKWFAFVSADAVGGFIGGGAFSVASSVLASTLAHKVLTDKKVFEYIQKGSPEYDKLPKAARDKLDKERGKNKRRTF